MKQSLSFRLISIMALSILLSSVFTIFLVSSFTIKKIRIYSIQRDRNMAITVADALSRAADEGTLDRVMRSLAGSRRNPRMGMGPGQGEKSDNMFSLMMPGHKPGYMDEATPLLITDAQGEVLHEVLHNMLDTGLGKVNPETLENGFPYYRNGRIEGYVLAGLNAGIMNKAESEFYSNVFSGLLLFPIVSAFFASILGALLLGKALQPLKSLYQGVTTLARGEYSYRVSLPLKKSMLHPRDELYLLSEGFNEMADSLEKSEEWKKQIISDTAHELRTPVSLIMGNLEMILDGVYQADTPRLEALYKESTHLAEMIRNLQVLASEESSQNETALEKVPVTRILSSAADNFRALAEKKDVSLVLEAADVNFLGDENKTLQVLKNLLVNALRFSPSGTCIYIRGLQVDNNVILEVEDKGPGVPEEYRERVFDRFYKMDSSRNSEGSGLGLAISKALIENQKGRIEIGESQPHGAVFRIILPLFTKK